MDLQRIGDFLKQLRRELGLTQADLGERLGVTDKTVSRWETGAYLPPVEMLKALSELYGVSINELVNGERIAPEERAVKAEAALESVMQATPFLLAERQQFWRRKWRREHRGALAMLIILGAGVQVAAVLLDSGRLMLAGAFLVMGGALLLRDRQEDYVEHHLYDDALMR